MSIPFENTNYNSGGGASTLGAGTGINVDNNTITNTLPDQTLILEPGTGINITGTYPEFTVINTLPNQQSNFTQANASAVSFISNKPIITTSSSKTVVGAGVAANAEGNVTAFGRLSGKQALNGHLCLGEESGEQGGSRAISIGYKAHATNAGSTVISASDSTLSSSANDAFFMEKLRTIDPNGVSNVSHMKINMYNTNTKEIFNVDNLLVPGTCKINGAVQFGSTAKISINTAGAIGFGSTPNFGISGTVLISGAESATPAWGVLPYSSLSGRPTALSSGTGISIDNNAIINTLPNVKGDFTQATSSNSAFILNKPIITTTNDATMVGVGVGAGSIEGNLTAFGKSSGADAANGHLCIGEESGDHGAERAISIGYKAHSKHLGSTVISAGGDALSSLSNNAFYISKLRTIDPNSLNVSHMKINMYNTNTKEIFNVDNLLVPGTCKINGAVDINSTVNILDNKFIVNAAGAIGVNNTFGSAGQYLRSATQNAPPSWATLPTSLSSNDTVTFNKLTVGDAAGQADNAPIININHKPANSNNNDTGTIARVSGVLEGTAGGKFVISTANSGGTVIERLRINNVGAVGFGGSTTANTAFGVAGEVLTSAHEGGPPVWSPIPAPVLQVSSFVNVNFTSAFPVNSTRVLNFSAYTEVISSPNVSSNNNSSGTFNIDIAGTYIINVFVDIRNRSSVCSRIDARLRHGSTIIGFGKLALSSNTDLSNYHVFINTVATFSADDTVDIQGTCTENTGAANTTWDSLGCKIYFLKIA